MSEHARERTVSEASPVADVIRRCLDVVVSLMLLLVLSPVWAVLALLVKLSSPGPVLFRQQRVGLNGKPFELLKFRSMRVAAGGPEVTAGGDARITPVGRFMREWKLDELPQFLNVLRGEMSLVGPRPEVPRYVAYYTPEQRQVLTVRPGITGITQLEYRNEEELLKGRDDVEEYYIQEIMPAKLRLDLQYVQTRTLLRDLGILVRTVWAVLRR